MKPKKYFTIVLALILMNTAVTSQDAWILKSEKDGIKVYTKNCDSSPVKSVKAECIVHASMTALLAVLLDIDNSKDWIYATKKVSLLKQVSPTEVIYYSEVGLPWPICNRDFIADFSIKKDSLTNVVTATCTNRPDYLPRNKNIVRVEHSYSQWVIIPLADGKLHVQYELQVDPGGNIPSWLTNLFAATGPFCTFQKLRDQVKKSEYKNASLAFLKK
jgi:hypothetical protein